ncbi:MAG TPA: glycoside hydrolase family 3 N-terminal domain-containing protein [Micromonosporaceae bacterium]|nr:glycoside hydrolase family 3 N-terminal domain-containing protein [Micromonosporaceae bacterium]
MDRRLAGLADAVLQPGFDGTSPPDWIRRRLADGLRSVVLYARNIGHAEQVASLTAALRAERPDVIVAIDEEAGDVTRLEARTGSSRPGNLALGAADDVELTEAVAHHLGQELAGLGITLDYAPDADVNSNPDNPVIGVRAFGADPQLVARHTVAWVRGLQLAGVASCAKHFPGHGDTGVDSHHDVPVIAADRASLDACELVPFRAAIDAGVRAVMTGHLVVPAVDPHRPATLSKPVLTDLLRVDLGFDGLIVTDAIEMDAVARRYGLGGATVAALAAGADAVCVGGELWDEATAVGLREAIVRAVLDGALTEERLVDAAERVATLASWSRAARLVSHRVGSGSPHPGLTAARRAIRITAAPDGVPWPFPTAPHVVELSPPMNMAIAPGTPWGVLAPLSALVPATTGIRLTDADLDGDAAIAEAIDAQLDRAAGRSIVVVVRDAHRHEWMRNALKHVLATRPDAVVVEMGLPAGPLAATQICTYGASSACARAVAELLAGVGPTSDHPAVALAH